MNEKDTIQPLKSRRILGTRVDATSYADATARILQWARARESRYVCVCTVHMIMEAYDSESFREIVNGADLVTPDGMPLVWTMRVTGIRHTPRVDGPSLTPYICEGAARAGIPICVYGGTEQSQADFRKAMQMRYPGLKIACMISPPFRPLTKEDDARYEREIVESGAGIVLVAFGCPKQERWMMDRRGHIPVVMVGVGAALDFQSGLLRRAPMWMQKLGLEWFFRLLMEPRRLLPRYARHNQRFIFLLLAQLLHLRKFDGSSHEEGHGHQT
jgi:N-acetylglucosaminyldiphosphoundecaprenol N-acetyl-beta-D-mannosaminyltransferase